MLTAEAEAEPNIPAGNCRYEFVDPPRNDTLFAAMVTVDPTVAVQLTPPTKSKAVPSLKE